MCHPSCRVSAQGRGSGPIDCYNENPDGCNECVEHAHRDSYGACECDADWAMREVDYNSGVELTDGNAIWNSNFWQGGYWVNIDDNDQYWAGCTASADTPGNDCRGAFDWSDDDPYVWTSGNSSWETQYVEI